MRPLIAIILAATTVALSMVSASAHPANAYVRLAALDTGRPLNGPLINRPDPLVKRIQKQLHALGIYRGQVNGIMDDKTAQAIRLFQQSRGLTVDGKATENLANTLETDTKVNALLKRLQSVREARIDEARKALLADPYTRSLIDKKAEDQTADPTRDPTPCFHAPSPKCLLHEATESAKAVAKDELRDWAFGEILAAQARAGLASEAMGTARRITDPRLIIVALRQIAVSLARAGDTANALRAATVIPDPEKRLQAEILIAGIVAGNGTIATFDKTVRRIVELLKFSNGVERARRFARIATLYESLRERKKSAHYLRMAETASKSLAAPSDRDTATRYIAIARADMGDPKAAQALLKKIHADSDKTPVLTNVAQAYARAGDIDQALAAARAIQEDRYRAVVLSDVAGQIAQAGHVKTALATIETARQITKDIKLPYARSFAASRVAMALLDVATATGGSFADVIKAAQEIKDDTLRSYTLWAVATEQRRAGDKKEAAATRSLARGSTDAIKSQLSRVWLYADLTDSFALSHETAPGWKAFHDGLNIAQKITDSWSRARSLAKLADAMSTLAAPEAQKRPTTKVRVPAYLTPNGQPSPATASPPPEQ